MASTLDELTQEALKLSPKARLTLAESLLLTVEESEIQTVDEDTVVNWERRLAELRSGEIKGVTRERSLREVRQEIEPEP